jgi:Cu/Ag efflux pump CusA
MATALMGGITVATVLTLFFLPALYAAWFRVRHDEPAREPALQARPALESQP